MNTKIDTTTSKADEAFERFYIELVYRFPFVLEYMKDVLQVAWVSGATWATKDSNQRLEKIIK